MLRLLAKVQRTDHDVLALEILHSQRHQTSGEVGSGLILPELVLPAIPHTTDGLAILVSDEGVESRRKLVALWTKRERPLQLFPLLSGQLTFNVRKDVADFKGDHAALFFGLLLRRRGCGLLDVALPTGAAARLLLILFGLVEDFNVLALDSGSFDECHITCLSAFP